MKNRIIQLLFFIFCISSSQAQSFKVGAEVGFTAALGKIGYISTSSSLNSITAIGPRLGVRLGVPMQYQLANSAAIHSGLFYSMKGINKHGNNAVGLFYNSIELPVALVYKSNRSDANNFFVGGGGYVAYAISGKVQAIDFNGQQVSKKVKFGNTILENDMRCLDYGLHLQAGVAFQNGLQLRLVAQRQLNDMAIKSNGFAFT